MTEDLAKKLLEGARGDWLEVHVTADPDSTLGCGQSGRTQKTWAVRVPYGFVTALICRALVRAGEKEAARRRAAGLPHDEAAVMRSLQDDAVLLLMLNRCDGNDGEVLY